MAISVIPTPSPTNPQRANPLNFRADADQYVNWHTQNFVPELTQIITDINATIQNLWVGTSATSVTIGTGSKAFTVTEDNLAFGVGNSVRIANTAAPTSYYMSGIITAYNKTTKVLTVNVLTTAGTATKNVWTIVLEPPYEYNRVNTWSAMTGVASLPLIVEHNSVYYSLNTYLADVTAKEPGVDPEWSSFGNKTYQEFIESGTWTKPVGCNYVYVQIVSGGNSGSVIISATSGVSGLLGGAGGICLEKLIPASDLAATETVIVGAGGAAKSATATTIALQAGNVGGGSAFGSFTCPVAGSYSVTAYCSTGNGAAGHSYRGGIAISPHSFIGGAAGGSTEVTGISQTHGNGGALNYASNANVTATAGSAPGGGGGAAYIVNNVSSHTATSGAGARGCVRVWTW